VLGFDAGDVEAAAKSLMLAEIGVGLGNHQRPVFERFVAQLYGIRLLSMKVQH
jgi:hypothetical protein